MASDMIDNPKAEAKHTRDVCWFIERGTGEWWTADGRVPWSRDPLQAIRFCRQEDANAVISGRYPNLPAWQDCNPFASEHIFVSPQKDAADPLLEIADRWSSMGDAIMSKGCPVGNLLRDTRAAIAKAVQQ